MPSCRFTSRCWPNWRSGIDWVQIDEPALVLELPPAWLEAFQPAYDALQGRGVKLLLTTYFEGVSDNLATIAALPVQGAARRSGARQR